MAYTFRLVKGSALSWAELDTNFQTMDQQYTDTIAASAIAISSANFKGTWGTLTGALNKPASVFHNNEYWMLLNNLANVTTSQPGVSADWTIIGNLRKTGDTMTGPLNLPSNGLVVGTNQLVVAGGNVGVGNAPAATSGRSVDLDGVTLQPLYAMRASGVTAATATWTLDTVNSLVSFVSSNWAMRWNVNGSERLRIDTSGDVLVTGSGGLGYGVGSGGTVTQTGSRTTGVTLNKPTGSITLVLASGSTTWQSFTLTNSSIAINDVVHVCQRSGTDLYEIHVTNVAAGSCGISFRTTVGTTTEQPVFNFAVIKGATS